MKHLLLTFLALPTLAFGQAEKRHVRFIPLGELPDWTETLVDGVRVGGEIPPGSYPPKDVASPTGDDKAGTVGLTLMQPSGYLTFGLEVGTLSLSEGAIAGPNAWIKGPMPAGTLNFGVLFRDPNNMTWFAPKMLMLKDDPGDFPPGTVRFVNVADLKAIVKIGNKAEVIPPGETLIKPLKPGENPILVGYYDKNNAIVKIYENSLRLVEGQRIQAFLFKAQGAVPRSEVKFHNFPETIPKP